MKLNIDNPTLRQMAATALRNARRYPIYPRREWSYTQETYARARDYIGQYLENDGRLDPPFYQRQLLYVARAMNAAIARAFNR